MNTGDAITGEQARYIHANLFPISVSTCMVAVAVVALFGRGVPLAYSIAFLLLTAMFGAYCLVLRKVFTAIGDGGADVARARRLLHLATPGYALSSLIWGIALHVFFPTERYPQQVVMFCSVLLNGMLSVFSLGAYYPAFVAGVVPMALVSVAVICLDGARNLSVFIYLLMIFIPLVLGFSWRFNRLIVTSLALRFENVGLIAQLTEQKEAAESATLTKSRFLAAASHDLRQPMHALNLYLGTLTGYALPEAARSLFSNARLCAQTMDEMFSAMLDISRLDASITQASRKVFPVAGLLEQLRMEFEPQATSKSLRLRVMSSRAWVESDPTMVERILRNLVSNAVRYTVRGTVLVGCRQMPDSGRLRLAVYDTGPGIAPEHRQAIFEEFYQIDNPGRNRAEGLGLGLAIVQRLAQVLDAPLSLHSEPGRGSVFMIDVPMVAAQATSETQARADTAESALSAAGLAGALIAVVDDETLVLNATRALLEQWGCHVVTAESGPGLIARLDFGTRVPDAIICDFRLQDNETGNEVIATLRSEFSQDIPALLITGDTAPDSLSALEDCGLRVLHKPLREAALKDALLQMVGVAA